MATQRVTSSAGASGYDSGSAGVETASSVASIGLSRQLPPVPQQRLNYNFAVPETRGQSGLVIESRNGQEQYPGLEQSSNRWTATSTAPGNGWMGPPQTQTGYQHGQGLNHASHGSSRMSNGMSGKASKALRFLSLPPCEAEVRGATVLRFFELFTDAGGVSISCHREGNVESRHTNLSSPIRLQLRLREPWHRASSTSKGQTSP